MKGQLEDSRMAMPMDSWTVHAIYSTMGEPRLVKWMAMLKAQRVLLMTFGISKAR